MTTSRAWLLPTILSVLVASSCAFAAAPRMEAFSIGDGRLTLQLHGDSGKRYRIESSTNLTQWITITEGLSVNGLLTTTHDGPARLPWIYYRGRELSFAPQPYPTVVPSVDTNYTAASLLTPELGGLLQIRTADDVVFTLDVPTNAVFTPTLARMTLVTNLTGIAAAEGFLSAVRLEPAGLVLASPTFLRISYPTNLPSSRIASYGFDSDGKNFHLTPDLVSSNQVRILVNRFLSYGSGQFTLPEIESLVVPRPAPAGQQRRGQAGLHATMAECYPDQEAEARAMRKELEEAIRPILEQMAREISLERQRQQLGMDASTDLLFNLRQKSAEFYAREITPRAAAAVNKCAVARELLTWMFGFERQNQLLGGGEQGTPDLNSFLCEAMANCQKQILECCKTRGPDIRLVIDLLGVERQRQLLGMTDGTCGSLDDSDVEACAPVWYGEVKITQWLRREFDQSTSDLIVRGSEVKTFELSAVVATAEEDIVEPFPFFGIPGSTNITLKLIGLAQGAHTLTSKQASVGGVCPGGRAAALASIRPHDGVTGFRTHTQISSVVSNMVNFEVQVVLTDGTGVGPFAPKDSLELMVRSLETPWVGLTRRTSGEYFGSNCEENTTVEHVKATDHYAGVFVMAQGNQFQHTDKTVSYFRSTKEDGLTTEVLVRLRRKK